MPAFGWKNALRGAAAGVVLTALGYAAAAHGGIVASTSGGEPHAWDSTVRPIDPSRLHPLPPTPYDFDGYGDRAPLKPGAAHDGDEAVPAGFKTAGSDHPQNGPTNQPPSGKPTEPQVLKLSLHEGYTGGASAPQVIAAVPEPGSLSLLFGAGLAVLRRSRRK